MYNPFNFSQNNFIMCLYGNFYLKMIYSFLISVHTCTIKKTSHGYYAKKFLVFKSEALEQKLLTFRNISIWFLFLTLQEMLGLPLDIDRLRISLESTKEAVGRFPFVWKNQLLQLEIKWKGPNSTGNSLEKRNTFRGSTFSHFSQKFGKFLLHLSKPECLFKEGH